MSDLKSEFLKLEDFSTKWEKYFDVYENILNKYKNKNITFVEIGIFNGGSLKLWKKFFELKFYDLKIWAFFLSKLLKFFYL